MSKEPGDGEPDQHVGTSRRRRWRPVVLWVLALFLLAVVLGFYHFLFRHPVGEGPAGPTVDRARFQNAWTTQTVFLVGLGDSVTAGFGAEPGRWSSVPPSSHNSPAINSPAIPS